MSDESLLRARLPDVSASGAPASSSHATRVVQAVRSACDADLAGSHIERSWARCMLKLGIQPETRRDTNILPRVRLREHQQQWGALMGVARRELENLYELIAGTGYVVALADAEGTVLSTITDPALKGLFRNAGLWLGAVWDERHEGTNGIGTCLAEGSAVTVHRDEHFRDYNTNLSCSGAPIVNMHGKVIGALDASSANIANARQLQRHTMALVSMSASLISRCQFLSECPKEWVLRFHSRPEFVGLLQEALLAVDEEGRVRAANDSALLQLGYADRENLVGQMINEVFAFEAETLQQRAVRDPATIWPVRDVARGRRFFALVRPPLRAPRPSTEASTDTATPADGMADHITSDPTMRRNFATGHQLFVKQVPILLHGETGTGKDVFARALHEGSAWADKPFVTVNCAAIPESLIESELFGYQSGAFTGAAREGRTGRILQSSGGTLFLDEIGDMPLLLQARLLRAIEAREIMPVGSDHTIAVDLHVISATHRDLQRMITAGDFREDLYYRLAGTTLELPSLRQRADKRDLIAAILRDESDGETMQVSEEALHELLAYEWPGNIRQLRNVLRTAAALCRANVIRVSNLAQEVVGHADARAAIGHANGGAGEEGEAHLLQSAERSAVTRALEQHGGNVSRTAEALGISRNTLYRKIHKHDICSHQQR